MPSFISCLGHASYYSNRKVTRKKSVGKSVIAMTGLPMLICRRMWPTLGIWARKAIEYHKQDLMGQHSQSFKDSGRRVTQVLYHEVHSRGISSTRCTAKVQFKQKQLKAPPQGLTDGYPGNGKGLTAVKVEKELSGLPQYRYYAKALDLCTTCLRSPAKH